MNEGLRLVIDSGACATCKAEQGQLCKNYEGKFMQSVHTSRKKCPVCRRPYMERSGRRFSHFGDQEAPAACTAPKAPKSKG